MNSKICIFGGSSLYRLPIYNEMAKKLNCDFYICEDDPKYGIVTYNHEDLITYKGSFYPKKVFGHFFWLKGALKLFFKDYDVFVLGGPFGLTYWFFLFFSIFSHKKVASWSHGMYGKETGVRRLIKLCYYKSLSMNFVYNNRAVELMKQAGIPASRLQMVGNSLDTDHNFNIRKTLAKSDSLSKLFVSKYPTLLFVGRVTNVKRLDMVLDAMILLKDRGTNVNFLVVGKDVDGVNLKEMSLAKGLKSQVYLYGPCYDDNILGDLFFNSDLCVSPGNVGLTAISALSFGCPVLSNDNFPTQMPEFESIVPGKTGDFFKDGSVESLADQIKNWLDKYSKNEEMRDLIRLNAYKEIDSKWNIYSECEAFEKGFNNLK